MKARASESTVFIICIFLSLTFIFLESQGFLNQAKRPFQEVILPFQRQLSSINLDLGIDNQENKDLEIKIKTLEEQNALLLSQLGQVKSLEIENERIRKLLGADLPARWRFSPAQVVGKIGDELLVSTEYKPQQDEVVLVTSIQEDLWKGGLYVGKVEENQGSITRILLPTSPLSKLSVVVRKKDSFEKRATGILEGRGGRVLLDQVVQTEVIEKEDLVFVTPNEGDILQEELLIGRIEQVYTNPSSFQKADVELLVDLSKLDLVFFLTKK